MSDTRHYQQSEQACATLCMHWNPSRAATPEQIDTLVTTVITDRLDPATHSAVRAWETCIRSELAATLHRQLDGAVSDDHGDDT